jgi:hypothetical protein
MNLGGDEVQYAKSCLVPIYYFHLRDGETILDGEGIDLPDLVAVWHAALATMQASDEGNGLGTWIAPSLQEGRGYSLGVCS